MKEQIKSYFNEHRDFIFTIVAVLLIDHFILGGALRDKIKSLIDKLLNKAERSLEGTPNGTN